MCLQSILLRGYEYLVKVSLALILPSYRGVVNN